MTTNPSEPLLSVVIVNYKTRALTLDMLASIYQTTLPTNALEVIVIDNASGDGSAEAIQHAYPQARVIANAENRYFSAGYTQGIRLAHGQYVIALNSDMRVQGDSLVTLVQRLSDNPHIGAATTTMHFPDGRLQRNCARLTPFWYLILNYTILAKLFPRRLAQANDWLWYAEWDRTTSRPVESLPGSCIIARRDVWQSVGGFDARMKMYFSDDYLSRRVTALGLEIHYLTSEGIIHYEGASAKQMSRWALRIYLRDLLVYIHLVYGRLAQIILAILLLPTYAVQWLRAR
ncbi:MAG TPA: glycosyltransferase family 2 protein [Aggregatilineales bacterium]|nr:glycosyltransferase family 2 protein [Anaerolineales bacterium]HRE46158.1 glycosyltransferase family 2 protein [Aggregatilineales bacterium]